MGVSPLLAFPVPYILSLHHSPQQPISSSCKFAFACEADIPRLNSWQTNISSDSFDMFWGSAKLVWFSALGVHWLLTE
jgi:hypothetical protein